MTVLAALAGMAAVLIVLRIGGFALAEVAVPPAWQEALGFAPIATLTALIVSGLLARPADLSLRLPAAIVAAAVAALTRRAWLCIAAGFAVYTLLRWL